MMVQWGDIGAMGGILPCVAIPRQLWETVHAGVRTVEGSNWSAEVRRWNHGPFR